MKVCAQEPAAAVADRLVYERRARDRGFQKIAGVDEAGRGPWAGPVVAACVLLPDDVSGLEDIRDSKKISPAKRRELYLLIHERALGVGVGLADAPTIDRVNILQATFMAMRQAVAHTRVKPDYLLIDGNRKPEWAEPAETIVKGDALSLSIGAASIVAKVLRDKIMEEYDHCYPDWGFAQHKGYGTEEHMAAIEKMGICDLHRRSFAPVLQRVLPIKP